LNNPAAQPFSLTLGEKGYNFFMQTLEELFREMKHLVEAAGEQQLHLRAFGGLAVLAHSQTNPKLFQREAPDLDFLAPKTDRQKLEPFFRQMGYSPDKHFNLLNGMRRQIYYYDPSPSLHVDILIGDFEMCHKLPLDGRLELDPLTIPLADLLLTKAQVVQLNHKDALDILSLLLNNEVGDEGQGQIGLTRIASLCAQDWGLYKTVTLNIQRIEELLSGSQLPLTLDEQRLLLQRLSQIKTAIEETPKTLAWQMRAKVGTRVRWYIEVEEVHQ
jgi:hypothetical protein